jgi:hypothetical protein
MQRLLLPAARARCTQPLLSKFSTFHLPLPVASQTKERCVQRPCLPTAAALPVSKKWVCTEFASLLVRPTNVPASKQRLPLTAVCSGNRFWRALGPPGDQSGDRLGSVGMRGLTPRGKDAPCATDSLTTCYETPDVARIETHDAARARGCWRSSHDGQLTVLYCVPTNPGPRSFHAWPVRRCHWPVPSTHA